MVRETGQVVPLAALIALLAGVACLGLGRLGGDAVGRAEARTVADAAALAGALAGEDAAREAAEANGGRVARYESAGGEVRVEVKAGRFSAVATARVVPNAPVPIAGAVTTTQGGG